MEPLNHQNPWIKSVQTLLLSQNIKNGLQSQFSTFPRFYHLTKFEKLSVLIHSATPFGYTPSSTSEIQKTSNFELKIMPTSKMHNWVSFWSWGKILILNRSLEATLHENIRLISYVRKLHFPVPFPSLTQKFSGIYFFIFECFVKFDCLSVCFMLCFLFLCF